MPRPGCGWRCSPGSTRPRCTAAPGVHVAYLARELAGLVDLTVHCQGADRPGAVAHRPWDLLAGANQALRDHVRRPGDDRRGRGRRPGALAHLVRQPGRPPGRAAVRRAARDDRALAGAAAAVEGRAAGRRVRAVQLVRAGGGGIGGRGDRGVRRACGPTCWPPTRRCRRSGSRVIRNGIDTAEYAPDPGHRRAASGIGVDPAPADGDLRRPDHPAERACRCCSARRPAWTRRPSWCSCAGQPDTARAGRRGDRAGDRPAGHPVRGDLDPGDAAQARRSSSCCRTPPRSPARRCTSRSAS